MSSGADSFLKKALGADFFQSLEKVELWKMGTKTVVDHEEIKTALQIVPRTLMSFLISNLQPMLVGETKEIALPIKHGDHPILRVSKHEKDVYSGELEDSTEKYTDKKVAEFKYRSIPGIGLVIMSTFELYDVDELDQEPKHDIPQETVAMVQKMIDERLALHDLIGKVVDKKMTHRDAIQSLVLAKLSDQMPKKEVGMHNRWVEDDPKTSIKVNVNVSPEIKVEQKVKIKKVSPLKGFLEDRQKKLKKNEYAITMTKGEDVSCPDCGQHIFKSEVFSGCICFGDDMDKKVYLAKTENGMKVRFGKGWDPENMEMLLEVLRRHRG